MLFFILFLFLAGGEEYHHTVFLKFPHTHTKKYSLKFRIAVVSQEIFAHDSNISVFTTPYNKMNLHGLTQYASKVKSK